MFFYHSEGDDDTLLSCVKFTKAQEKKDVNMYTRKMDGPNARPESLSVPRGRTNTSNGHILENIVSYEGGVPVWKTWKPFPENPLWTSADFPVAQVGNWDRCCSCSHHLRLKSSYTDMDLLNTWVSVLF